jgi:HEPN domain-containing protein
MYLTGDKFTPTHDGKHQRQKVDSYEVTSLRLDLGQWRKHWALHNYINDNYGDENRHQFPIDKEELLEIAEAVEQGRLPDADYSPEIDAHYKEPEQVAKTAKIFRDAAAWLDRNDGFLRDVEYTGSW